MKFRTNTTPNKTTARGTTHVLMLILILIWTVDSITVSKSVSSMNQLFLLGFKTLCSLPLLLVYTAIREGLKLPSRKDLPAIAAAAFIGDILYFLFEYTAYKYLPVGTATILIGIMPAASYLTDCFRERSAPRPLPLLLIIVTIIGMVLVVYNETGSGSIIGYISCFLCIAIWILYGFTARRLNEHYSSVAITLYESVIASAAMLPFAIMLRPSHISAGDIFISIILMGMLTSGFGYMIEVRGLIELGNTVSGIYLNLLPVTTAIAGFIFLRQVMTPVQILGAFMVIVCGIVLIRLEAA